MSAPENSQTTPDQPDKAFPIQGEPLSTLVRLLDQYHSELQAGAHPNANKLLADYPQLASQLKPALEGLELIHAGRAKEAPVRLGDFQIKREIGRGGMGIVYEAEQLSLKRRVALKILRYGAVADVQAMQRFQREAQTVAGLHHTNIVPIFAVGTEDGTPYYAMQFIEGQSLAEIAANASITPAIQVAEWGLQAADALAHAHARGVIHRDIKPSNLILDRDGRIWLTDFGLAKRADDVSLSLTGALLGTPRYMSPEQASSLNKPVDHRTDLYSLGATLYELAAGRPIFQADSPDKILTQILTVEPVAPRKVNPTLPRDLETIILKCLAKDAHRRYHNAQDLTSDLRAFREGRPIHARRPAWPERTARWIRKHKRTVAIASASAAGAALLVIGVALAWQSQQRSRLGQLTLTTKGPRLLAEVIDQKGQPVVAGFPVPTPNPITLPAGDYRLRLSAAGLLSETWPLEIERRAQQTIPVELNRRHLWPPLDFPADSYSELEHISTADHEYLAVLSHSYKDEEVRLRLIDGAKGSSAWKEDVVFSRATAPAGTRASEWLALLRPSSTLLGESDSRLLQPSPDLDQDNIPDLVWFSRTSPSLIAISGATGQLLWSHRGFSPMPTTDTREALVEQPGPGSVVGYPISADVDNDGVPDVIAAFTSLGDTLKLANGRASRTPRASWIAAVSGKDGRSLWSRTVKHLWENYTHSSDGTQKYNALVRLSLLFSPARVLLLHDNAILCWNVTDGQDAQAPVAFPFTPALAPVLTRANTSALLLEQSGTSMTVHAVSLPGGAELWSHTFQPPNYSEPIGVDHRRWFNFASSNNDHNDEIVLATLSPKTDGNLLELQVISVASGKIKWQKPIPGTQHTKVRALPALDLNQDGGPDLFVAYQSYVPEIRASVIRVDALSGVGGQTLWSWQLPHSGEMAHPDATRPMALLQMGKVPMLVVPILKASGGQNVSCILSATTGELAFLLPEVANPQLADLNHDGLTDLFHFTGNKIVALQGLPQGGWNRLGTWTPAGDLNSDKFTDLISPEGVVRSGQDHSILFGLPNTGSPGENFVAPPARLGDLDGDSCPDIIRWERPERGHSGNTIAAYSGRRGNRLWIASEFDAGPGSGSASSMMWSSRYPALYWADLDGDQRAEIIVLHMRKPSGTALTALSGKDGHALWTLPALRGAYLPVPSPVEQPFADLNGDRVIDPVLWVPLMTEDGPVKLGAYDGRNGQSLWMSSSVGVPAENRAAWPQPLARDLDEDGFAEVITVTASDSQRDGYECQLVVSDGRSGLLRWSWSWRTGFPNFLPPLVVRFAKDSSPALCIGVSKSNVSRLVCFAPDGTILRERVFSQTRGDLQPTARHLWRATQSDGLLLFQDGDNLCAWNGDDVVWQWPIDSNATTLLAMETKSILIWSGYSLFGLDPTAGHALWRGQVDATPQPYNPIGNELFQLSAGDSSAPPWLLYQRGSSSADGWATVCRPAWPTNPGGRYQ